MKKITLIFALAFLGFAGTSFAQWDGKGTKNLDLGIGLGSTVGVGGGLPIRASYDVGYNDNISIGGYLGYVSNSEEIAGFGVNWKYTYTNIIIGARGAYHYPLVDNFDTYGGLMLGYNIVSAKVEGAGAPAASSASGISYSLFVGGRYMFTDKIGAFAELGYGISWLQLGVSIKM